MIDPIMDKLLNSSHVNRTNFSKTNVLKNNPIPIGLTGLPINRKPTTQNIYGGHDYEKLHRQEKSLTEGFTILTIIVIGVLIFRYLMEIWK